MLYRLDQVKKFLPHRDPFLFVDHINAVQKEGADLVAGSIPDFKDFAGISIEGAYKTKKDHPIFAGHFPGNPILPGVVQVEMMAQIAGFILHASFEDITNLNIEVALLSVNNAKFRRPIFPEMDLIIKTDCTRVRSSMIYSECKIFHEDTLMSEAEVMASVKT